MDSTRLERNPIPGPPAGSVPPTVGGGFRGFLVAVFLLFGVLGSVSGQETADTIWRAATDLSDPHNQAVLLKNINQLHTLRGVAERNWDRLGRRVQCDRLRPGKWHCVELFHPHGAQQWPGWLHNPAGFHAGAVRDQPLSRRQPLRLRRVRVQARSCRLWAVGGSAAVVVWWHPWRIRVRWGHTPRRVQVPQTRAVPSV